MSTRDKLLEQLARGACQGSVLAHRLWLSKSSVYKALRALEDEGLVVHDRQAALWALSWDEQVRRGVVKS